MQERYKYGVAKSLVSAVFNPRGSDNAKTQDWVYVDFEDIFLSDRDCSLRIKFNPQVTSFKNIIQEQKIETIGNRFPFFFRNGQLQYRELPISGLISTEMDEYFAAALSATDTSLRSATDAGAENGRSQREIYYNERKYREKVEAWLNNGQPKVFRSPTEGNYILRLTGVSMTPNQQLSRRLHTFNATGYEIADYNILNLISYKILPVDYWYRIGEIAGLGVWGKVRGSTMLGSVSRGSDKEQLLLNKFDITKVVGGPDILIGDISESKSFVMMMRSTGDQIADSVNPGLVIASEEVNRLNTNEEGVPFINAVSFDKIKLTNGVILQIGPNQERVQRTSSEKEKPDVVDQDLGTVRSSSSSNGIKIDASGYMTINTVTNNKIIQEELKELYIGGGGV